MHTHILQIVGDPASVDHDAGWLAICIQVRIERSDDLDTFFAAVHLVNLDLGSMVKNTLYCHWFHGPFLLELIKRLYVTPKETTPVQRCDVYGRCFELLISALSLVFLVFTLTLLVLSALLHENECWQSESRENNLLFVHFF